MMLKVCRLMLLKMQTGSVTSMKSLIRTISFVFIAINMSGTQHRRKNALSLNCEHGAETAAMTCSERVIPKRASTDGHLSLIDVKAADIKTYTYFSVWRVGVTELWNVWDEANVDYEQRVLYRGSPCSPPRRSALRGSQATRGLRKSRLWIGLNHLQWRWICLWVF